MATVAERLELLNAKAKNGKLNAILKDDREPHYIVRSKDDALFLWRSLQFAERMDTLEIGMPYAKSAVTWADESVCEEMIATQINADGVKQFSFRPFMLCFKNDALFQKLKSLGLNGTMLNDIPKSLDEVRSKMPLIVNEHAAELKDMPSKVLDGWLGDVCRKHMGCWPIAYAWPALLSVASAMVPEHMPVRVNLYAALVGPAGSGKSHSIQHAIRLLGIKQPPLLRMMTGSAEGLMASPEIQEANGGSRLLYPGELGHLMEKMKILQSSFPFVLNEAFYETSFKVTMARGQKVDFNCILSVLGGLVEDRFQDLFGSATTGGLYDRFIYGHCPDGFKYNYRPLDEVVSVLEEGVFGAPARPLATRIDRGVWAVLDEWRKKYDNRVVESALRVAAICAAFDNREVLRPDELGPALAFADYQQRIRGLLRPNPGVNPEGIIAHKILDFLRRADGQWVTVRSVLQKTHAYDFGPNVASRVIAVLAANGDIEITNKGKSTLARLAVEAPAAVLAST
jgi:hypothetical protein